MEVFHAHSSNLRERTRQSFETLRESLHHQLDTLAQSEDVPLSHYVLSALTRQAALSYSAQAVLETEVAQQRAAFATLLNSLGQASFAEIEKTMQEREAVEPEVVRRLQSRIAKRQIQN